MCTKKLYFIALIPFLSAGLPLDQINDFSLVFETVKDHYVDHIDEKILMNYAISGMINQLDPHSDYMDPSALQSLESSTNGKFGGLGVELSIKNNLIEIMTVVENTPAWDAHLQSHDIILAIDGIFTQGMSLKEAGSRIRGEPGSMVTLTILKENASLPVEMKIERMVIKIPSVQSNLIDNQWGYIKISVFGQNTAQEFLNKIEALIGQNSKGIILDLRNNPGGLLKASTVMANCFLDEKKIQTKTIVFARGRNDEILINELASGKDLTNGLPIVVLVNQGSASASEIVAGALQDHQRAIIMGEPTFGKGSVQTVIPINGKALKLTSSRYFTPSGRSIQARGITPDIIVSSNWEQVADDNKLNLKEQNLNKHLNTPSPQKNQKEEPFATITNDFQLNQAIQTLKALTIIVK